MSKGTAEKNMFSLRASTLLGAVAAAARAVAAKPVLPALENLLVEVLGGILSVSGSDTETTVKVSRELVSSSFEGSFLVDPAHILDTLKGLDAVWLEISVNESFLDITWPGGTVTVPVLGAADWPERPEDKGDVETAVVAADDLLQGLSLAEPFCAKDELRPVLCGVSFLFLGYGGGLEMVASETHRLCVATILHGGAPKAFSFILPQKACTVLRAMLKAAPGEEVSIRLVGNFVTFSLEDRMESLTARLVEGSFPNWKAIIPKDAVLMAEFSMDTLVAALQRMEGCAGKFGNAVFTFGATGLALSASDLGFGLRGDEDVSCAMEGEPVTVAFAPDTIIAALKALPFSRVRMEVFGDKKGVLFKDAGEGKEGEEEKKKKAVECFALVMPRMADRQEES